MVCASLSTDLQDPDYRLEGPRSYLSICSKPGVQWVEKKLGTSEFSEPARRFTSYITGQLKIEGRLSSTRMPEPDAATAWRYTAGN